MKKILNLVILMLVTNLALSNDPPGKYIYHSYPESIKGKEFSRKIDLKLNFNNKDKFNPDYRTSGVCLLIAGIAFTTASILEGGYQYGTYKSTGSNTQSYVIPPFHQQQPRFAMFIVGCGMTIGGFGITISK